MDGIPSESVVLDIRGLTKAYGQFIAVDNLDMQVRRGEFMGLLGPNGAGKSTTLKCITGLVRPSFGTITVNGVDYRRHVDAMAGVGCVIETPECYASYTPAEVLEYAGRMRGMSNAEIASASREALDLVRMWDWRDKKVSKFSKGMRQRVAIATALLPSPEFIILDEPTSGLDPRGMVEVREILNDLRKDRISMLISTHILKEVSELCSSITLINHGKVVTSGRVDNLLESLDRNMGVCLELRTMKSIPKDFLNDLKALEGVRDVRRVGESLVDIDFNGSDQQRLAIVELVRNYGIGLMGINQKGSDLEELYMELTDDGEVSVQ